MYESYKKTSMSNIYIHNYENTVKIVLFSFNQTTIGKIVRFDLY